MFSTIEVVNWKKHILECWPNISVESVDMPDVNKGPVEFGTNFHAEIILNMAGLNCNDIGVEILMGNKEDEEVKKLAFKMELDGENMGDNKAKYVCNFPLKHTGVHDYTFRIFPKNSLLAYRMDFPLVNWV